jgi:hypothetical protein
MLFALRLLLTATALSALPTLSLPAGQSSQKLAVHNNQNMLAPSERQEYPSGRGLMRAEPQQPGKGLSSTRTVAVSVVANGAATLLDESEDQPATTTAPPKTTAADDKQSADEEKADKAANETAVNASAAETEDMKILRHDVNPLGACIFIFVLLISCFVGENAYVQWRKSRSQAEGAAGLADGGDDNASTLSDNEEIATADLEEDLYSLAIMSVVVDSCKLAQEGGSVHSLLRHFRMMTSFAMLFLCLVMQCFAIICICDFAAGKAVGDVRTTYDAYEKHMYDGHWFLTTNGYHRGSEDKYFNISKFHTLDADLQDSICQFPISQPWFLGLMLVTWTICCVGDLRENLLILDRLVLKTETASSMKEALSKADDSDEQVVVKLTNPVKAFITVMVVLPRIFITAILLWLGCRWLLATNDFQNLVCNAVAMEFILCLKEMLYKAMVPGRSKRDVQRIKLSIAAEGSEPTPVAFLGSFAWAFMSVAWVYLYIFHFQAVLPYYQWDVQKPCLQYMKENYAGWV